MVINKITLKTSMKLKIFLELAEKESIEIVKKKFKVIKQKKTAD